MLRHLGLADGEDTDTQGLFTVSEVACLGCCTLAPVVQIDGVTYGHIEPDRVAAMVRDFLARPAAAAAGGVAGAGAHAEPDGEVRIGMGSCCIAGGSATVGEALARAIRRHGLRLSLKQVGCVGICHQTPLLEIVPRGGEPAVYAKVKAVDVEAILLTHFTPRPRRVRLPGGAGRWVDRLLTGEEADPADACRLRTGSAPVAAFFAPQVHLATEHGGALDPVDLADYRARDGFQALRQALLGRSPGEVVDEVRRSGLRGRGGAGYPSGTKWAAVRAATGAPKYIVCNGDEGDPGAFMDRMIMESYPFRVLEGMAIAAYAVGADRGYLYIRAEYPLALRRMREALAACTAAGLLGPRILGSGFSLHLRVAEGAGAFVCGEETALIASIEGRRGMPSVRPPYPAMHGLWGRPTLVNNWRRWPSCRGSCGTARTPSPRWARRAAPARRCSPLPGRCAAAA